MNNDKLWKEYEKKHTPEIRNKLIENYAPLVKIIAGKLIVTMGDYISFEELCSFGVFGLIDAIEKYDINSGYKFETYSALRIRGAIIDEIRRYDIVPRQLKEKKKRLEAAKAALSNKLSHFTREDLANELGIDVDEYYKWEYELEVCKTEYLDELFSSDKEADKEKLDSLNTFIQTTFSEPEDVIEEINNQNIKEKLINAISSLTKREQEVIQLLYYDEVNAIEISHILNISQSRVSQIHSRALVKLKDKLGSYTSLFAL